MSKSKASKKVNEKLKMEVASELGIDLKNKDITAREAGSIGGKMAKKLMKKEKKIKTEVTPSAFYHTCGSHFC